MSHTMETQASDTGDPFQYFIWCAGLCVVEVDVLTGEVCIPHAEIVYDCGQALNPLVDIGQIEGGAFRLRVCSDGVARAAGWLLCVD